MSKKKDLYERRGQFRLLDKWWRKETFKNIREGKNSSHKSNMIEQVLIRMLTRKVNFDNGYVNKVNKTKI